MQLKFPESRRLTLGADDLTHRWSCQSILTLKGPSFHGFLGTAHLSFQNWVAGFPKTLLWVG